MKRHPLLFLTALLMLTALACEVPFPPTFGQADDEPATEEAGAPVEPARPAVTPRPLPDGMPKVELDYDLVFNALTSGQAPTFESFAVERYEESDFAGPGALSFTVSFPASQSISWQYGWCASDEKTLSENLQHIFFKFLFNGEEVPSDWLHGLGSTQENGWECAIIGMLLSDWKPGDYEFETIATFDAKINDGGADFDAGDYIFKYDVSVK